MDAEGKPLWDDNFESPEYLYKIILVCIFFGFILFLIFFALVRYLKFQNKARAILLVQQEREAAQFPPGFDGLCDYPDGLVASGGEAPIIIRASNECTCKAKGEDSCVCQPLTSGGNLSSDSPAQV